MNKQFQKFYKTASLNNSSDQEYHINQESEVSNSHRQNKEEKKMKLGKKKNTSMHVKKNEPHKENDKWLEIENGNLLIYGRSINPSTKLACFDLDNTLIKKSNHFNIEDPYDWSYYNENVVSKLRKLNKLGYRIVVFTNRLMHVATLLKSSYINLI